MKAHLNLIAYVLIAAAFVFGIWRVENLAHRGVEARNALCVFRSDLQQRHDQTQALLDDHPGDDPIHAFGLTIPRAQLVTNAASQQATLDSLSNLHCE